MSVISFGNPLKVYLAAPYRHKERIKEVAAELRASGITVTSRWLEEPYKSTISPIDLPYETNRHYAMQDIEDVSAADVLVLFTDPTKTIFRAGRHVEFGIAVGLGLSRPFPIFVVGPEHENIFHYLGQVQHFETWEVAKEKLLQLHRIERVG